MATILVTGAAGRIGTAVTPLLRDRGHRLRLLDLVPPTAEGDEVVIGSATDEAAMRDAAEGADLLLHLAGHPSERSWRDIVDVNLEACRVVLDAARNARVPVTVLASSVHAAGFVPSDRASDRVVAARPDTYYGFGKAAGEALAQLYADRFAMRIVSARIMTFDERPRDARSRSTWLSPGDFARLVESCLNASVGHSIVWGVSANTRRSVSLEAGAALGYHPTDDAEEHLDRLAQDLGLASPDGIRPNGDDPLGGAFTGRPLGETW